MKKKYFFFFFLCFFLQFSFWPVVFGLRATPLFLLAFLVVLSGKIPFKESFWWFSLGGLLSGYFSPWSPVLEMTIFALLSVLLFVLEKLFLWQRQSLFLEGLLLIFAGLFFDGGKFLLLKALSGLDLIEKVFSNTFVFKEYIIETSFFLIAGLVLFFCFRKQQRKHYY